MYDFDVGRRLKNLEALKAIGFTANRRLLGVQRISQASSIGTERLEHLHASRIVFDHCGTITDLKQLSGI